MISLGRVQQCAPAIHPREDVSGSNFFHLEEPDKKEKRVRHPASNSFCLGENPVPNGPSPDFDGPVNEAPNLWAVAGLEQ